MSNLSPSSPNYFALSGKIDPISEIKNAGLITSGKVIWVKDPSDDDYSAFKEAVGSDDNFSDTIQGGIDKCTSDTNDYVLVCPKKNGAVWQLSEGINLDEDNVHLISVGYMKTNIGYSNTLEGYASATVHDDQFLYITGNNCEVAGFRFSGTGAGSGAAGKGSIDDGLLYVNAKNCWVHDCHMVVSGSASTAWDVLGSISCGFVKIGDNADGARFDNFTMHIGTTAAGSPTLINVGAEAKDVTFADCSVVFTATDTDNPVIRVGTGDIGCLLFDRCKFVNINSATLPASLAVGNVTAEEGIVLFDHCSAVGFTAMGTDTQVFIAPGAAGGTIASLVENTGLAIAGTSLMVSI
jgi:hypothetical protein